MIAQMIKILGSDRSQELHDRSHMEITLRFLLLQAYEIGYNIH
jgi:hypothetical protein